MGDNSLKETDVVNVPNALLDLVAGKMEGSLKDEGDDSRVERPCLRWSGERPGRPAKAAGQVPQV